jgi:hypothetical protein
MPDPNDLPLPEMSDAVLGPEDLSDLFRDYRACAGGVEIQVKSGPGLVNAHPRPSLDEAEQLLLAKRVRGLQLRYRFDGGEWCDTLMQAASGVRLIRIRQQRSG